MQGILTFVKNFFSQVPHPGDKTVGQIRFNDCKDHRNKKEVPDPIVKDLISDKIRKRNKSKADLTVENFV